MKESPQLTMGNQQDHKNDTDNQKRHQAQMAPVNIQEGAQETQEEGQWRPEQRPGAEGQGDGERETVRRGDTKALTVWAEAWA